MASADSRARGSLVAYSSNQRKSLSEIYLPPIAEDKAASKGYRGRDEYAVLEGVLGHRFPVYRDGDADDRPTGGMRQLQYKLVPGEAGWLLKRQDGRILMAFIPEHRVDIQGGFHATFV